MLLALTVLSAGISAHTKDKVAILVAQYGSTVTETCKKTIDLIFEDIKTANPDAEVREAYIADAVRNKMEKMGVHKDSPTDALLKLHLDGYNKVIVLPTLLLDGTEMDVLRKQISKVESLFDNVTVSPPLLNTIGDFQSLFPILVSSAPKSKGGIILVGHGNAYSSTGSYSMIEDMLQESGHDRFFVSTIEGYPTVRSTVVKLKKARIDNVTLIPLLLVCGNHTLTDINGQFRRILEDEGLKVDILFRGLAEVPEVRMLYVNKLANTRRLVKF